jgi:hypothetical protein
MVGLLDQEEVMLQVDHRVLEQRVLLVVLAEPVQLLMLVVLLLQITVLQLQILI